MSGVVLDGWEMREGKLIVPDTPGIGFDVEPEAIERGTEEEDGFVASL
jgi:L-alanine-DL-glutamate epimerase-like enolase superfamily enzyme